MSKAVITNYLAHFISDCPDPKPAQGQSYSTNGNEVGSITLVQCDTGYTLEGSPLITCMLGGNWSVESACSAVGESLNFGLQMALILT